MSSKPVTEIITLHLGPKFSAEAFKPVAEVIKAQPGCQRVYWGRTVEDDQIAVVFVEWDKIEDHQAVAANPDIFKPFIDSLTSLVSAPPEVFHVPFEPFPPTEVMKGPVIELTILLAKEEPGAREKMLEGAQQILALAAKQPKCTGTALGFEVENVNKLVLILSWPNREAHMEEFQKIPEFIELVAPLRNLVDHPSFTHVKVQQA